MLSSCLERDVSRRRNVHHYMKHWNLWCLICQKPLFCKQTSKVEYNVFFFFFLGVGVILSREDLVINLLANLLLRRQREEDKTQPNLLKAALGSSWKILFFKHYFAHNIFSHPFKAQTLKNFARASQTEGISNIFSYYMQVCNKGT